MNATLMGNIPFAVPSLEELHTAFDEFLLYDTTQVKGYLNSFISDTLSTTSENMLAALEHRMLSGEGLHSITNEVLENIINTVQINENLNSLIADVPHRFTKSDETPNTVEDNLLTRKDLQSTTSKVFLMFSTQLKENFNTSITSVSQKLDILTQMLPLKIIKQLN